MGRRVNRNVVEVSKFFYKYSDKDFPILDIGCGDAWGLENFKRLGFTQLFGIELVQDRVNTGRNYGFDVAKGAAEETVEIIRLGWLNRGIEKFNIFCAHTLEHTQFCCHYCQM